MPNIKTQSVGRPRSQVVEKSILDSASAMVLKFGYVKTSIEMIAADAGVGKASIYRRWSSKAEMMIAVYRRLVPQSKLESPFDTFSDDFGHILKTLFKSYRQSSAGIILIGLITDSQSDSRAMSMLKQKLIHERSIILKDALKRAINKGELRQDIDLEYMNNLVVAMIWHRLLIDRNKLNSKFVATVIDTVLTIGGNRVRHNQS